ALHPATRRAWCAARALSVTSFSPSFTYASDSMPARSRNLPTGMPKARSISSDGTMREPATNDDPERKTSGSDSASDFGLFFRRAVIYFPSVYLPDADFSCALHALAMKSQPARDTIIGHNIPHSQQALRPCWRVSHSMGTFGCASL